MDKINSYQAEEGEEDEKGGQGGKSTEVKFTYRDAMSIGPRDDQLPPKEVERLFNVHHDISKDHTDKQRETRKERAVLKEGKQHLLEGKAGMGMNQGYESQFKEHPTISDKPQFSGMIDKQVTSNPKELETEANNELQEALQNRLENRKEFQHQPKFNPRPRAPGG